MTSPLHDQLQSSLGTAYTVERELGGAGMSRVFLAEERRLGRRVVVKVLSPELAAEVSAERFERETRVAAKLQDPRIVPVLSAGEAAGLPFYTMPYIDGTSLRHRMSEGPIPLASALSILRDIALALEHAHEQGIVHRDIKPENVLLTTRGRSVTGGSAGASGEQVGTAMVTDFGISKAIAEASSTGAGVALTQQGTALGTPAYMAPEQAAGDAVDHRADLYAWGMIAYELLGRVHPFADKRTAGAMVAAQIRDVPPSLANRGSAIPPALVAVVDAALSKDPAGRPGSAAEVVRTLETIASVASPVRRRSAGVRVAAITAAVAAAVAAAVLLARRDGDGGGSRSAISSARSIAVLPFVNRSPDTADVYFAEGMSDELTTALGRLASVRVASRSSAARYRDSTALQAARGLSVDAVLEGTVRRVGTHLRITAALTGAADGTEIWSHAFDQPATGVFDVQDSIVAAIVDSLRFTLTGESRRPAALRGTSNLDAYDLYLQGRYAWSRRGRDLLTAVSYYQRAVALDSGFARAYAGMAMSYAPMMVWGVARGDSVLPLAEASALRALAIDSTLGEAHLALASVRRMQWRWDEAERHFRAAIGYSPSDATAHQWYGGLLYSLGRVDEGVPELLQARDLDPVSAALGTDVMYGLYAAGRFDQALTEGRRTVALDTTLALSHWLVGITLLALDRPDSALRAFETSGRLGPSPDVRPVLVRTYRMLSRAADADSLYAAVLRDYRRGRLGEYDMSIAAVSAGNINLGLEAAKRAIERREAIVTEYSLPCDRLLQPLHAVPEFSRVLERVGMRVCQ